MMESISSNIIGLTICASFLYFGYLNIHPLVTGFSIICGCPATILLAENTYFLIKKKNFFNKLMNDEIDGSTIERYFGDDIKTTSVMHTNNDIVMSKDMKHFILANYISHKKIIKKILVNYAEYYDKYGSLLSTETDIFDIINDALEMEGSELLDIFKKDKINQILIDNIHYIHNGYSKYKNIFGITHFIINNNKNNIKTYDIDWENMCSVKNINECCRCDKKCTEQNDHCFQYIKKIRDITGETYCGNIQSLFD